MASRPAWRSVEIWIPAAIVLLDQITKALVRQMLPLHESVAVVPGLLNFTHIRNTGAAFGFLNAVDIPYKTALLSAVAVASVAGVLVYGLAMPSEQRLSRTGLALIVGGAVGNLIDRLSAGFVVDFVDVYWRTYHFWAFNVADSAITVGVILWLLDAVMTHVSQTV